MQLWAHRWCGLFCGSERCMVNLTRQLVVQRWHDTYVVSVGKQVVWVVLKSKQVAGVTLGHWLRAIMISYVLIVGKQNFLQWQGLDRI